MSSPVAPNTSRSPKHTTFTTVNINVKSNPKMSAGKVRADVRRAATKGDIIGWNEISPKYYFRAIRNLGPNWSHYMPRDGKLRIPNPISWNNKKWKLMDSGNVRTHHGMKKVSPNRYITWVKLKNRKTGEEMIRMNTHLVSGAFSGKSHNAWRKSMWHKHMDKLKDMVNHFEKKGYPVIVGGDFNRNKHKVLGNQVRYDNKFSVGTHGRSVLDYMMHVPDPDLKKVKAAVDRKYHSDHNAVIVRYTM